MAWSTRELAELANTTVNTIRHYHRMGLLDEPDRRYNGYKQYEVRHLVSLLRIRRLADLGVPLSRMRDLSDGVEDAPGALRDIDVELQMSIERLQNARADIASIIRHEAPVDSPAGFESVASGLSDSDTSMIHLYTQLFDQTALADVQLMAADTTDDTSDLDRLSSDADEETRQVLIEKLAETLTRHFIQYPWLSDPAAHLSKGGAVTAETFVEAMVELYNPAQLDVLSRASVMATERVRVIREQGGNDEQ